MFESILRLIEQNDSIVINGHPNPDGDCYGSQIGLKSVLLATYPNKHVFVNGSGLEKFFPILGKPDDVSEEVIKNSLCIILDGNDILRMEDKRIINAKCFAKIDHHVDKHSFTEGPEVILEDASSTAEIIVQMIEECHLKMTKTAANGLYLGILTDSGRFQMSSNFSVMFKRLSFLVDNGATPEALTWILNITNENDLKVKNLFLNKYKITNAGVIYAAFKNEEFSKYGYTSTDMARTLYMLGNVKDTYIWCSFAEGKDGRVKLELRSNGVPVQPIAVKYGGGGHMCSSGATIDKYDEEVINNIINDCDEAVKAYLGGK